MAILKQSVIGTLSGKIGDLVGATWKGISVLKVAPASVANPKTDKQLAQRAKVKATMAFLQPLTQFVRIGWREFAVKMTAMNAAVHHQKCHSGHVSKFHFGLSKCAGVEG